MGQGSLKGEVYSTVFQVLKDDREALYWRLFSRGREAR
jgi:hypothetical protein